VSVGAGPLILGLTEEAQDRQWFRNELGTRLTDVQDAFLELGALEDVIWDVLHGSGEEQLRRLLVLSVRAREAAVTVATRPSRRRAPVGSAHPR
jgi:hypothetical protein